MHALYDLKEKLVEELEEIGKKPSLDKSSLDLVDKLAHATKNLCKVIEACEEEEYSGRRSRRSYDGGSSMRSMDRYDVERGRAWSSDESAVRKLEQMAESADENTRRAIKQAIKMIRG